MRRSYKGKGNPNWRGGNKRTCLYCGNEFVDGHYDGKKFCNRKCYGAYRYALGHITIKCHICQGPIEIVWHDFGKRKYCSPECMGMDAEKSMLTQEKRDGWIMDAAAREKISIAASSRKGTCYSRGQSGRHLSPKAGDIYYRSSYEKRAFELLDDNPAVITYKPEPFVIPYTDLDGNRRRYRPDILVYWADGLKTLVEVKATWQLDTTRFLVKTTSGVAWARQHGMEFEVWTGWTLGLLK